MSKKRKGISKRTRFEVFKRDSFTCQYCGAHPPSALLHADHITPVVADGENDMDNLVTACEACNLGKGPVQLDVIPQSLAEKAAQVKEREEQLFGYQTILEARRDRIEQELWRVAEIIAPGSSKSGMSHNWASSIRRFNNALGVHVVLEAADIARGRYPYSGKRTFLYFCGICWRQIRKLDNGQNQNNQA